MGRDSSGYRQEFINLVEKAQKLDNRQTIVNPQHPYFQENTENSIQFKGQN
jgi:hypothetical protein